MAIQMGLEVEVFVVLVDELIKEHKFSAHFSPREHGCKVLDCRYLFYRFPQLKS